MVNDSTRKTVLVALIVCLVCSILVSTAVVTLKGIHYKNNKIEKMKNIFRAADIDPPAGEIQKIYQKRVRPLVISLEKGEEIALEENEMAADTENFDIKRIVQTPGLSLPVPAEEDIAGIKKIPKFMVLYIVTESNGNDKLILPVYGRGLWSTMYGFLALDYQDLRSIRGISFYQHGETPGLGGEIDNPAWQKSWQGKQAFNSKGEVIIKVLKGKAAKESATDIDGLSGASITSRGVNNLIQFWLGDHGYGPYIEKLRQERNNG